MDGRISDANGKGHAGCEWGKLWAEDHGLVNKPVGIQVLRVVRWTLDVTGDAGGRG